MRSYIQNNLGEQQPLVKAYYIAPMFRQERPQAGRMRQFHQFGAEAIGGQNPAIDAEIITLSLEVYRSLGIGNFELRLNSVGCANCRPKYREALQKYLRPHLERLTDESRKRFTTNPFRILDSKEEEDRALTKDAPLMKDHLCQDCAEHFNGLQKYLKILGIDFIVDGRIVRGLDYYTKTAFEIISKDLGSQDALAGGGRYDLLVEQLGGKPTPSVGFAAGMERLLMVMEKQKLDFGSEPSPRVFIIAADDSGRQWSLTKAIEMRRTGISCDIDFIGRSVKSQMREADRQHSKCVIVVGEDEINRRQVRIKNMGSGKEEIVAFDRITDYLLMESGKGEKGKTS
jgi:histidyl-tRNA synthetase